MPLYLIMNISVVTFTQKKAVAHFFRQKSFTIMSYGWFTIFLYNLQLIYNSFTVNNNIKFTYNNLYYQ